MKCQLMLSTYYYGFRDQTVIVECDDDGSFGGLFAIARDTDFMLWALDNGFQACAVWINGIGNWGFIPTRLDIARLDIARRSPLAARRSPLAARRSPLAARR